MMIPTVIVDKILLEFMPINKIYIINKNYNNIYNNKIKKNVITLQNFCKRTSIPPFVIYSINEFSDIDDIRYKYIRRFWVRQYPKYYIMDLIKLSIKKLKNISSTTTIKNLKTLYINENMKNENYLINMYVNFLSVGEIEYVGW